MKLLSRFLLTLTLLLIITATSAAQDATLEPTATPAPLPVKHTLQSPTLRYEAQLWNNCGPATLTSAMSYFGYADNQVRAANWLKPNTEDKNVSPWQMVEYVNTQIPELAIYALKRYGGSLDTLKLLIANDFPVIIEAGYDPEPDRLGWMGHYLFVKGYDDGAQQFLTNDSYDGENLNYSYDHVQEFWQHFNYVYIVVYESGREPELLELLGTDADENQNLMNALQKSAQEAAADRSNAFAWFNLGSNLAMLEEYERAAVAYDEAFKAGLPWRMLWYQFGPFEAYNAVERYNDTIQLAQRNLNDGGGQYVEETFYYAGRAREGLGESARAAENYRGALAFNPNFTPARERLNALTGSTSN